MGASLARPGRAFMMRRRRIVIDAARLAVAWGAGVLIALLAGGAALSALKSTKWWVRIWDYPRLQIAVVLFFACLLFALTTRLDAAAFALLGAGVAALVWEGWFI